MFDVKDAVLLFLQAYNDRKDIFIISDDESRDNVMVAVNRMIRYINSMYSMNTNVLHVNDPNILRHVNIDDLVILVNSKNDVDKAFCLDLAINDLNIMSENLLEFPYGKGYENRTYH
jgi:hypothetical protein